MKIGSHAGAHRLFVFLTPILLYGQDSPDRSPSPNIYQTESYQQQILQLEKIIPQLMTTAQIPGLAISVVSGTGVIWSKGFGVRNLKTRKAVTDETVFKLASLSKPVFSCLVMRIAEEGLINLDTPLLQYVPAAYIIKSFFRNKTFDERFHLITARMVLSHTTGLPNWRSEGNPLTFEFNPGEHFSYSGEGLLLLQKVIEYVTEKKLNALISAYIFQPLKMTSSSFTIEKIMRKNLATGYNFWGETDPEEAEKVEKAPYSMYSTITDYSKFLMAILDGRLLQKESWHDILRSQSTISQKIDWGLGIGLEHTKNGIFHWHWGDNWYFRSFMIVDTTRKRAVVYLTNSYNGLSIGKKLIETVMGGYHPAFDSRLMATYPSYESHEYQFMNRIRQEGFEKALQFATELDEVFINDYGYYLLRKHEIDKAITIFEFVIDNFPRSESAFAGLGHAYMNQGQRDRAIHCFKTVLEMNPNNSTAREALNALQFDY